MINTFLEKYATEIHERSHDNLSISDLQSILFEFLEAVADDVTRYDLSMSGEMVAHKQGEFVRYESIHS